MMSVGLAERVAAVLGGRVWQGESGVVRVYFGGDGRSQCWISSRDDGSPVMQLGRGTYESDVDAKLHAAGLVTATARATDLGSVLDDVRFVAQDEP